MPEPSPRFTPTIEQALAALPTLRFDGDDMAAEPPPEQATALQILSRQGRNLLRLNATYERLTAELDARDKRIVALEEENRRSARQAGQVALAAIQFLDTLDALGDALAGQGSPLVSQVEAARRDFLRRLSVAGITEISTDGMVDGQLHESVGTEPSPSVPPYHIVRVVRRGFQRGPEILRHAEVITATPPTG